MRGWISSVALILAGIIGLVAFNSRAQITPGGCGWNSANACFITGGAGGVFTAQEKSTAAAPSYSEGTVNPLSGDLTGNLRVTNVTALPAGSNVIGGVTSSSTGNTAVVSSAGENNHVLKNSAGTLFTVYAVNLNTTTAAFLDILNVTTAPSDGAVAPLDFCYMPPGGACSITYNAFQGAAYSTGITAVITSATTPLTKTTGTVTGLIVGHVS
jgi:hypothetical protein